ncbi:MAG TPA: NAD(P)(+) transhydrogenase (Re/Si-specific) subunit beta, partial [Candidatus Binatia bacterium]|nr:NAD(P)(+) transhydrogenase (Re/Si-specific) subunit beta [Candidatus Binatia bacterium]
MSQDLATFLYLISAICFIMSLRGLSSPETSRGGLRYGIGGMILAIVTTLLLPSVHAYLSILIALVIGGGVGILIARQIQMTA